MKLDLSWSSGLIAVRRLFMLLARMEKPSSS